MRDPSALLLLLLLFLLALCTTCSCQQPDPSYDHQTVTYYAKWKPLELSGIRNLSVTPFFSPDHTADVQTWIVGNATEKVDIEAPGWNSWSECSYGCTPSILRNTEAFPVWQALLNALHNSVKVRILVNDYSQKGPAQGNIDPLTFLYLNGAEVRYFASVTFLHSKYLASESATSISSCNFDFTSYMLNREAGVILTGSGSDPLRAQITETFEADWAESIPFVPNQNYSAEAMAVITNTSQITVLVPPRRNISAYQTPLVTVNGVSEAAVFVSPDFAFDFISTSMYKAQKSIAVEIYQITNDICDLLLNITHANPAINLTVLVSLVIFDPNDSAKAQACYANLTAAGVAVRVTTSAFTYAHQKFWLVDYEPNTESQLPTAALFLSTGNWGQSDFPAGPSSYPPYGQTTWQVINRDVNFKTSDPNVMKVFHDTLEADYFQGSAWQPPQ